MAHSSTTLFLAHWRGLQVEARKAPAREDFDPTHLKRLMPQMLMLSTDDTGHRFRLTGGFIERLHGTALKTRRFDALFLPTFQAPLSVALTQSRHREQPLLLSVSATITPNMPNPESEPERVTFDILLTPLRNRDGLVDRFVGLYQPHGPIPEALKTAFETDTRPNLSPLTLVSSRLQTTPSTLTPAHLRLVVNEGCEIA